MAFVMMDFVGDKPCSCCALRMKGTKLRINYQMGGFVLNVVGRVGTLLEQY